TTPAASPSPTAKPTRTPKATPAKRATPAVATKATPAAGGPGMVWVNTDTHTYHKQGSRFYGKKKSGKNTGATPTREKKKTAPPLRITRSKRKLEIARKALATASQRSGFRNSSVSQRSTFDLWISAAARTFGDSARETSQTCGVRRE